jgi:hypothetical protein|tara:strand:- start:285 stop:1670 length:1386 start_codon:yes stop_codon:yes gene_type:complete
MLSEQLIEKWQPVLDHGDLGEIKDTHRRAVTAQLLENQERSAREGAMGSGGYQMPSLLGEASPTNAMGASSSTAAAGNIDIFDPVLISLVRRSMPNLIAYDICGVQPMTGPTGLIFAMRARFSSQSGTEALYNEADTSFGASAAGNTSTKAVIDGEGNAGTGQAGTDPTTRAVGNTYSVETGMSTTEAEALGGAAGANAFQEMAFSIEKVSVTAVSRALKAEYTMELAQDLKAIHGLDAETELSNILSAEILAEINREVVRTINYTATAGAQQNTASAGTFNLDVDSNGRWSVERFKGLIFQIERDANQIAKDTRRGKGNVLICSSDVASALQMAGVLDYTPALSANLNVDDTGNTFAGVLNGRVRVYIDPYFASSAGNQYYTIGYKGSSAFDAGIFYCPYVPLQMVRAVGENTFQPKIGFKTRYGMVANPFAQGATAGNGTISFNNKNVYYRLVAVSNLM